MKTETENNDNRFKDENYTLNNFQNEIFVECPKCSKRATIKKTLPFLIGLTEFYLARIVIILNEDEKKLIVLN